MSATEQVVAALPQRLQGAARVLMSPLFLGSVVLALTLPLGVMFWLTARPRATIVPHYRERVVILGASSGTGATLAKEYAARGCRLIVLVARRKEELEKIRLECQDAAKKGEEWAMSQHAPGWEENQGKERYFVVQADCTKAEDLVRVREVVQKELGGIDTLHICFGVSSLKPLLGIASVDPLSGPTAAKHASQSALSHVHEVVSRATEANVTATALSLAALLPVMQSSHPASPDPCVALLSSMAALIPAPTRALYGATKAAQLLLFEGVALEAEAQARGARAGEQPKAGRKRLARVRFVSICPGTIRSDFRSSAVDVQPGELESIKDNSWSQGGKSDILTPLQVAQRTMYAVDQGAEGRICMPPKYAAAAKLQPFIGWYLRRMAHKKYAY